MSENAKPSKTSPQFAATLRKIMLVEQIINKRNADFESELKAHLKLNESKFHPNVREQKKLYTEVFTRAYYAEEMKAIAEFEAIKLRHEKRKDPSFSGDESPEVIDREKYLLSQGVEHYVAQSLFSDNAYESLSKKYPKEAESLKREIKVESEKFKGEFPASAAHFPATVSLFNKRYPNLNQELVKQLKDSPQGSHESKLATSALGMLKVGSAVMNPSAYLVKMAIGAILQTKTMQPLVKGVSEAIGNVVQKSGLKEKIRSQFSDVSWKRVAVATAGVAALGTAALMAVGIVDYEESKLLVSKTYDSLSSWFSENARNVGEFHANNEVPMGAQPYNLDSGVSQAAGADSVSPAEEQANGSQTIKEPSESLEDPSNLPPQSAIDAANAAYEEYQKSLSPTVLESKTYKIVPGDTLSQIVESRLREAGEPYNYTTIQQHMDVIAQINGIEDQNKIFAGRHLELPPISGNAPFVSPTEVAHGVKSAVEPFNPPYKFDELIAQNPFLSQDPLLAADITLGTTPIYPVSDGVMHIESESLRAELSALSRERVAFSIVDDNGNVISQQSGSLARLGFITEGVSNQGGGLTKTLSVNGENGMGLIEVARSGGSITQQDWLSIQNAAAEHRANTQDISSMRRGMR